jgi:AP-4 complex subunit mu-1
MNYRMTQEFKPPFRVTALIEEAGPSRVWTCHAINHRCYHDFNLVNPIILLFAQAEVLLKIRADFSANVTANTIAVQMPVPSYTMRSIVALSGSKFSCFYC